jgi:hypothetical protein
MNRHEPSAVYCAMRNALAAFVLLLAVPAFSEDPPPEQRSIDVSARGGRFAGTIYLDEPATDPTTGDEIAGEYACVGIFGTTSTGEIPRRRRDTANATTYRARKGSQFVVARWRGDTNYFRSLKVFRARLVLRLDDGSEDGRRVVLRLGRANATGFTL